MVGHSELGYERREGIGGRELEPATTRRGEGLNLSTNRGWRLRGFPCELPNQLDRTRPHQKRLYTVSAVALVLRYGGINKRGRLRQSRCALGVMAASLTLPTSRRQGRGGVVFVSRAWNAT